MNNKKEIKLNLGCGVHARKGFINVDKYYSLKDLKSKKAIFKNARVEKGAKYVQADMLKLPFKDNFADYIGCFEVIEHFSFKEILPVFAEMKRVLKPGGEIELTTLNFDFPFKMWTKYIAGKPLDLDFYASVCLMIYGNQIGKGEFHRCPFTPDFMKWCLDQIKFQKYVIDIYPANAPYPKTKMKSYSKNTVCLAEMIYVKITK